MPRIGLQGNNGGAVWTFDNPASSQFFDGQRHATSSNFVPRDSTDQTGSSDVTPFSGPDAVGYDKRQHPLDLYQDQHWADLPTAQHTETNPSAASIPNSEATWNDSFDVLYDLTPPQPSKGVFLGGSEERQTARQDIGIPASLPVPRDRYQNASEGLVQSRTLSRSNTTGYAKQSTAAHMPRPNAINSETQGSTIISNSLGRGEDSRGPIVGTAGKQMSLGVRGLPAKDDDSLSARPGRYVSRESRSNASNNSYGEENIAKSDSVEDDVRSAAGRPFVQGIRGVGQPSSILRNKQFDAAQNGPSTLPAEKGFPIQIGSELFRLSGASIMSDAPSYFSKFFEDQLRQNDDGSGGVRTLYIDRDPTTFQDICRHLQGYNVLPRDGSHYVRLYSDAQFYGLPRLMSQLFDSEIFIEIGGQNFQIPRDLFSSPGDSPNFFSLGFAAFFSSPNETFPGLERQGLLRPPSIRPPSVPSRSAHIFSELLHLLRGYPLHIRNSDHRLELLRDCRYFHLRGLEQRLIPHSISFNVERNRSEIVIRLEDIKQSGVSFAGDVSPSDRSPLGGWVNYARPLVDETRHELILEINDESTKVDFRGMRADFQGDSKARITSLFQVVANKMNLPTNVPLGLMMSSGGAAAQPVSPGNTPLSEDRVKIRIESDAHIVLDGEEHIRNSNGLDQYDGSSGIDTILDVGRTTSVPQATGMNLAPGWPQADQHLSPQISRPPSAVQPPRKRKRRGSLDEFGEWIIRKGQWRLRVQPKADPNVEGMEIVLHAVKINALSGQKGRNALRDFLT